MRRLLLLAAGVLLIGAATARAATIDVTTDADALANDGHCSLREAVESANHDAAPFTGAGECAAGSGADVIILHIGNYARTLAGADDDNLVGDLDITSPMTISGAGVGGTTIDAAQKDRVIDVLPTGTLLIEGVTITGGLTSNGADASPGGYGLPGGPGGGIRNQGTLTLFECVVSHNATGNGGAGGSATGGAGGTGSSVGGNGDAALAGGGGGGGGGGGLWNNGTLALTRSVVTANTTGNGAVAGTGTGGQGGLATGVMGFGGLGGDGRGGPGGAGGPGGGVYTQAGSLTIDTSTISDNATGHGGNGGLGQGGLGGITQGTTGGAGGLGGDGRGGTGGNGGFGGGVYSFTTTTSITRSLITGNSTGDGGNGGTGTGTGGGASASPGSVAPAGDGGRGFGGQAGIGGSAAGLFTSSGPLTNLTIAANKTGAGGKGGNSTGGAGGAAATTNEGGDGGAATGGDGGLGGSGAGVGAAAATSIAHATLSKNLTGLGGAGGTATGGTASNGGTAGGHTDGASAFAGSGGAILAFASTPVTESNSITDLNSGPGCEGTVIDGGNNVNLGEGLCPGVDADPKLGALADNGGLTLTMQPQPGSPAIDLVPASGAGCAATDQRFVVRPSGAGCDAGAYELAPPTLAITAAGATTQGTVNPNARGTTYHFEFGTSTAYGSSTPDASVPAGVDPLTVSANLPGLASGTTYHVRLVGTNGDGTSASADATFATAGTTKDTTAPVILSASVKPKSFRRKRGTTFRYKLSEKAKVAFTIQRKKGKRFVKAKKFSKASKKGANRRKFVTRKLKPGRYRATLVATDAAGNHSKAKRLTFRVKR